MDQGKYCCNGLLFFVTAAKQALDLIFELQQCALAANHERPLLIAIDQENGNLNSVLDDCITQFPPAMAIAAAGSRAMAREVALATGKELSSLGVNWILAPVLDVLSSEGAQPLGVRAFGDDAKTVTAFSTQTAAGFRAANVACCGKHFPSLGDVEATQFSSSGSFALTQSIEQLRYTSFFPFISAIEDGLDAIYVDGCSVKDLRGTIPHACLSETVVTKILRHELGFNGVVLSECLIMEGVFGAGSVGQRAVDAIKAGCDLAMVCNKFQAQQDVVLALLSAVNEGVLARETVGAASKRIADMKDKYTSWHRALNPPGLRTLQEINRDSALLSTRAYRSSISLVRDYANAVPCLKALGKTDEVLLLTPLLELFPSSATNMVAAKHGAAIMADSPWSSGSQLTAGESVFQGFGAFLARKSSFRVLHTSYSSTGVRPRHEQLIARATAVVVITANATRNTYQYGVAKYVNLLCKSQQHQPRGNGNGSLEATLRGRGKPVIFVAVSSPWDLLLDPDIDSYICTYDYSQTSLETLADLLVSGDAKSTGSGSFTGTPPLAAVRRHKRGLERGQ